MARIERQSGRTKEPREGTAWDIAAIGKALNSTPQATQDIAHGIGFRFSIVGGFHHTLEVYPLGGAVRLTTDDAQISLYRLDVPHAVEDSVSFETRKHDVRLVLDVGGETKLNLRASGREVEQIATESIPQEEHPRLTLSGRVGAAPRFRTTPNGTLVARFPLAVRDDENKTTWHTVLAFGARAERLQTPSLLAKGQAVEVIGYLHTREQQGRDGKTKSVEELYAAVVKPR